MTASEQFPDGDPGLQPERTALAWRRLALVLLGLALASTQLLWSRFGAWALLPTVAIASTAALLLAESQRRYLARLPGSEKTPDGRLPLFAAVAATLTALFWLLAVASGRWAHSQLGP